MKVVKYFFRTSHIYNISKNMCKLVYRVISFANPIEIRYCLFNSQKKDEKKNRLLVMLEFNFRVHHRIYKIFFFGKMIFGHLNDTNINNIEKHNIWRGMGVLQYCLNQQKKKKNLKGDNNRWKIIKMWKNCHFFFHLHLFKCLNELFNPDIRGIAI